MSNAGQNETKRVGTNFLNGAAITLLATGYLGPLFANTVTPWMSIAVIAVGAALNSLARCVIRDLED